MKRIVVIQRSLAQYRIDFWNLLKEILAENGVALTLLYGKFNNKNVLKNDESELDWATYVPVRSFQVKGRELTWQPCFPYLKGQDLIIVEQANRNLINYILNFKRLFFHQKLAFWGHGSNLQLKQNDLRNRFKHAFITQCDWWFAYTENVKKQLIAHSFDADRITSVENAIDTQKLARYYDRFPDEELQSLKNKMNIHSDHVAIFCGSIYKEKRIPFLLKACDMIRERIPDFTLLVIGSGPDQGKIITAAATRDWIRYLGNRFDEEKVMYFRLASLYLMPGLVGLGILDAFALQTPLVTTKYPYHSPEIEYLQNNENGVITNNDLSAYVGQVADLMGNEARRDKLKAGCRVAAKKYTIENMAANFASGVLQCLRQ